VELAPHPGVVVVSGAASGIGRAVVQGFTRAGWECYGIDQDAGAGVHLRGDVALPETWAAAAREVSARHLLPLLRATRGSVVNVASGAGLVGVRRGAAYAASQGGVVALTRQMAVDCASSGVRVNAVCPGVVDTPLVRALAATEPDPDAELKRMAHGQLLGRLGTPEEVAAAILSWPHRRRLS
jgi:dihydroanticapsin dehydrogenase